MISALTYLRMWCRLDWIVSKVILHLNEALYCNAFI